jgi:hypothetical protein
MSAGSTLLLAGQASDDLELVRDGTDLIDAALREPAGRLLRGRYLANYGTALLELHRREPHPGDLDRPSGRWARPATSRPVSRRGFCPLR